MNLFTPRVYRVKNKARFMKNLLITVLMLGFLSAQASDSPETIFPKTKVIRTTSWYAQQATLWQQEIVANKRNGNAWLNYYTASRYAQASSESLTVIATEMNNAVGRTFEAMVVQALQGGFEESSFDLLMEAFTLYPEQAATYAPLTLFHELHLKAGERESFSKKLLNSGQISQSLLSYSLF